MLQLQNSFDCFIDLF